MKLLINVKQINLLTGRNCLPSFASFELLDKTSSLSFGTVRTRVGTSLAVFSTDCLSISTSSPCALEI